MSLNQNIDNLNEEDLLKSRFCDLDLKIKNTPIEKSINRFYKELEACQLKKPICYLADEWFCPDNMTVIAIPFYLAHPKLEKLEQKMMLEVEGGTFDESLKLLRHEYGHVLMHGFMLSRRTKWKQIFGTPKRTYQDFYRFRPYSKSYVHNLKDWYAQSHPEEDFAETVAVWLNPEIDWKNLYQGWPAINKLKYVDQLMKELKGKDFKDNSVIAKYPFAIDFMKKRLMNHYKKRKKVYAEEDEAYFDNDLKKIFSLNLPKKGQLSAAQLLRENRQIILKNVSYWSQERKYIIKNLLSRLIKRCHWLKLYVPDNINCAKMEFMAYFVSLVINYVFTSHYKRRR